MSRWRTAPTRKRKSGWLVLELEGRRTSFVHGRAETGAKASITLFGQRDIGGAAADAERLAKELRLARYQCATLLRPGEYQLLQLEAPNVPPEELKGALRWRLKDMLDYPVDEATLDMLEIPVDGESSGRARNLYAVAARNDVVQACIKRFDDARILLSVIDIQETAQRNIGALYEEQERGLALLHAGEEACLLTVNYRQELLLARRIEVGVRQFGASESSRAEAFERVVLELQRTLDLLDRQFPYVSIAKLMVAPLPEEAGLVAHLRENLGVRVEPIDLSESLAFEGKGGPDAAAQWRLFHLFGASLRQ